MNDKVITITLEEYKELLKSAERLAAVKRFLDGTDYPTITDIQCILGIEESDEVENG
jgi:hypothetical protein